MEKCTLCFLLISNSLSCDCWVISRCILLCDKTSCSILLQYILGTHALDIVCSLVKKWERKYWRWRMCSGYKIVVVYFSVVENQHENNSLKHENIFIMHLREFLKIFWALWKIRNMHKIKNNEWGWEFVEGEKFCVDSIERSLRFLNVLKKAWKFNLVNALLMKERFLKGFFRLFIFVIFKY